jgi:hypothetical protein
MSAETCPAPYQGEKDGCSRRYWAAEQCPAAENGCPQIKIYFGFMKNIY